ncbi:MAG: arabinosyltransferase domain-containing protein, partial [Actinomycetota bacterium]|nr:arabinosyltransferase domain-containing protein [Actinomycetota bacterium]
MPAGPCEYRITGRSAGRPSYVRPPQEGEQPPDVEAFARVGSAELVATRDGREVSRTGTEQLPDVDVLATSLASLPPAAAGDLGVELRVDDEFTGSPSLLKGWLIAAFVLALTATAGLLGRIDRSSPRAPRGPPGRPHPMDLVVAAVLVGWTFVAPMTPDDGYFGTQARNAALSGEIGNYYQAYDQSFVPFTWVYQALSGWQQLVGLGPVPQRIPALVLGVLTWLLLRWFVATGTAAAGRAVRWAAPVVLGAAFLAFWLPHNMGVRPEVVVALCGIATMLAVLLAHRRRRLVLGWLACALAGLGFAAHTTGLTVLAPLLAGLPLLWNLVRVPGARVETATRAVAVASGGMVAALAGFADGALRDFLRGQALFLSISDQYDWTGELTRYAALLEESGQFGEGSFAKRAAVLACLVALAWFAVLAAAARARGTPLPTSLWLAGVSTALSFALLAPSPSKWTHHFGALAGIGSAFLGLVPVLAVPLTRAVLGRARLPVGLGLAVAASFAGAIALSWHGPNSWLYASLEGVRTPDLPPSVRNVTLDSPVLWACVMGLVALALAARTVRAGGGDRRIRALWAVPIVVTASLAATSGYVLVTFGSAAVRGVPPGSIWAQTVADPTGCGPADTVRVLDPFTAAPLPAVPVPAGPGRT